jgi:hypothetical protein
LDVEALVAGRRFGADGSPLEPQFRVDRTLSYGYRTAAVTPSSAGFVVSWTEAVCYIDCAYSDAKLRFYDQFGTPSDELELGPGTGTERRDPDAAFTIDGASGLVTWGDYTAGLVAQSIDATGAPAGEPFSFADRGRSYFPRPAGGADAFAVVWHDSGSPPGAGQHIRARAVANADASAPAVAVGESRLLFTRPDLAVLGGNRFVATWYDQPDGPPRRSVRARFLALIPAFFADGFESNDTDAWSGETATP